MSIKCVKINGMSCKLDVDKCIKVMDATPGFHVHETLEYHNARVTNADRWVPACGGKETPFTARNGDILLYCWNPALNRHAYINQCDIVLTDDEARAAMGW